MGKAGQSQSATDDNETIADNLLNGALAGDLSRIPHILAGRGALAYEPQEQQAIIRQCVAACAQAGTTHLADALIQSMLAFDGALLLRAQTRALYELKRADAKAGPTVSPLHKEAIEEIERVGRIEERIVYLAQNLGKVQRKGNARRGGQSGGGRAVLRMTDYQAEGEAPPATGGE
ncbi:MAG: hypothetical protein KIS92_03160 [Planctomycetota bacterium]|nr:hypothetical protein [Planctomycetota bacterium]